MMTAVGRIICQQHHQQEIGAVDLLLRRLLNPLLVLVVMVTRALLVQVPYYD